MTPLVGTPTYRAYWRKRLKQLTSELIDVTTTEDRKPAIEADIDLIRRDRISTYVKPDCATCVDEICTSGCMA